MHELVRIRRVDGEVVAELQTPVEPGERGVTVPSWVGRAEVTEPFVVVACPCGQFRFDVGSYLDGEWVEPVELG